MEIEGPIVPKAPSIPPAASQETPLVSLFHKDTSRVSRTGGSYYLEEQNGKMIPRFVMREGDHVSPARSHDAYKESYRDINFPMDEKVLTEDQIRRGYIAMRIYKELGLTVPDVTLQTVDGKISLVYEDIEEHQFQANDVLQTVSGKDKLLQEDIQLQMDEFYLASIVVDNPDFYLSLRLNTQAEKEKMIVLPSFIPRIDVPMDDHSLEQYSAVGKRSLQARSVMYQRLLQLDNRRIGEIVKDAHLPLPEARALYRNMLLAKEHIMTACSIETFDVMTNTPKWDQADQLLGQLQLNEPFRGAAAQAESCLQFVQKVEKNISLLRTTELAPKHSDVVLSLRSGMQVLKQMSFRTDEDIISSSQTLVEFKSFMDTQLTKFPKPIRSVISLIGGYDSAQRLLDKRFEELEEVFSTRVDTIVSNIIRRLPEYTKPLHRSLSDVSSPTLQQIRSIESLYAALQQEDMQEIVHPVRLKNLDKRISVMKDQRSLYRRFCDDRYRAVVSHLTSKQTKVSDMGIRSILREGVLQSSLRQQEDGKKPFVNSPAGEREILAQLTFTINGAKLEYGTDWMHDGSMRGHEKETPSVVGFVAPYRLIVKDRLVTEWDTSFNKPVELHVMEPSHGDDHRQGIEIPIDEFCLFVPEEEMSEWESFLRLSKDEGGAERSDEWIQTHLRSYPELMDLDTYLHFFVDAEMLPPEQDDPIGIFDRHTQEIILHRGDMGPVEADTYKWIQAS